MGCSVAVCVCGGGGGEMILILIFTVHMYLHVLIVISRQYQLTNVAFIGLNISISSIVYWHGLFIVS